MEPTVVRGIPVGLNSITVLLLSINIKGVSKRIKQFF